MTESVKLQTVFAMPYTEIWMGCRKIEAEMNKIINVLDKNKEIMMKNVHEQTNVPTMKLQIQMMKKSLAVFSYHMEHMAGKPIQHEIETN